MDTETNVGSVQDNTATETANATQDANSNKTTQETTTTTTTEQNFEQQLVGAPEVYADYALPEGIEYNKEFASTFNAVAKELNLTQEQAQRLVDLQAGNVKMSMDLQAKQNADWIKQSEKTYGKEGIEQANKALIRFSTPEYVEYLAETGQGNNPAVIAQWLKVAEMVSEDKAANPQSTGKSDTWASTMYGDKLK